MFGLNGMGTESVELYNSVPDQMINESTHVVVLNACSHAALINEARTIFNRIRLKTPKIYTTMVFYFS